MSASIDYNGDPKLIMLSMVAALFAAVMAWQLNRLLEYLPERFLFILAPLQEEAVKTIPAIYMGAAIFFTHMFFGAAEGLWEILSHRRNGLYAGLAALASHSTFGSIAALTYTLVDAVLPAILAGYLVHLSWNYMVRILAGH
ncbi:MAG: hypothetical protein A4E53_01856 [Pelotomaculum sp. PtaB.Bin104]|nr:MAG: hypothetical protein A4E53_01856 [Pelotomaculum sp. PtaB.Bin104]